MIRYNKEFENMVTALAEGYKMSMRDDRSIHEITGIIREGLRGNVKELIPLGIVIDLNSLSDQIITRQKETRGITIEEARALVISDIIAETIGKSLEKATK